MFGETIKVGDIVIKGAGSRVRVGIVENVDVNRHWPISIKNIGGNRVIERPERIIVIRFEYIKKEDNPYYDKIIKARESLMKNG